ncbi:MAG: hypothetical protein EOP06_13630, partial [Proteobacteria bacterium]
MKTQISLAMAVVAFLSVNASAQTARRYELTIVNGSQMPLSPSVIYVRPGSQTANPIGSDSSNGFVQLCQSGNAAARASELKMDPAVKAIAQTTAPIMPGASQTIEIEVMDPQQQSVHFETMYGKTKDVCGVSTFSTHSLTALKQHVTGEVAQTDNTVLTGAFVDPVIPAGMSYLDPKLCPT